MRRWIANIVAILLVALAGYGAYEWAMSHGESAPRLVWVSTPGVNQFGVNSDSGSAFFIRRRPAPFDEETRRRFPNMKPLRPEKGQWQVVGSSGVAWKVDPRASFLGIGLWQITEVSHRLPPDDIEWTYLRLPYWLIVGGLMAFPAVVIRRRVSERRRRGSGLCSKCGYDLRAGHERCPECGHPIPPADTISQKHESPPR